MKAIYSLVGMRFVPNAEDFVKSLPAGEPLTLLRVKNNPHDANAIAVHARGIFVGYVGRGRKPNIEKYEPGDENAKLAARMDGMGDGAAVAGTLVAGWPPKIEVEKEA